MLGWIKLHRKVIGWEWYTHTDTFRVFIHLLLTATHKDKTWRGLDLKVGDVPTGRRKLSRDLNLKESVIRSCLKRLEKTNEIILNPTTLGTVITIVNFKEYQIEETKKKAVKTPKKEPKPIKIPTQIEFLRYAKEKDGDFSEKRKNIILKYESWVEAGWKTGHNKPIKNWKATLLNTLPHILKEKKQFKQML